MATSFTGSYSHGFHGVVKLFLKHPVYPLLLFIVMLSFHLHLHCHLVSFLATHVSVFLFRFLIPRTHCSFCKYLLVFVMFSDKKRPPYAYCKFWRSGEHGNGSQVTYIARNFFIRGANISYADGILLEGLIYLFS
jgi:hypothetical protein